MTLRRLMAMFACVLGVVSSSGAFAGYDVVENDAQADAPLTAFGGD